MQTNIQRYKINKQIFAYKFAEYYCHKDLKLTPESMETIASGLKLEQFSRIRPSNEQ